MPIRTASLCAALLAAAAPACTGNVSGAPPPEAPGGEVATPGPSGDRPGLAPDATNHQPPPAPTQAGPMPLHRLTREEYENTVRDLLGISGNFAAAFPAEGTGDSGFFTAGLVQSVDLDRLQDAAAEIAAQATRSLPKLLPCDPAKAGEEACVRAFIDRFGPRAFRRPLARAEAIDLLRVYAAERAAGATFGEAVGTVVEAIVSSAPFLYRWELGPRPALREGKLVRLDGYEIASRLSYFLWSSMPDDTLFAEAAAGKLGTVAEVEAQARRMLADPKAKSTVESFQRQWLTVTKLPAVQKDPRAFPEFTEALRAAMAAEVARFANFVILEGDGRLPTLLTAPVAFVNEPLAKIYGVDGVKGSALQRTATNPAQRFGVLTQAGVLATMANAYDPSLIARGRLVRERFLCQEVPAAPPDVPSPPPRPVGTTAREFFVQVHEKAEGCAGCHLLMDPIGFAFEGYDAIGRIRTSDSGRPIDARGEVRGLDGANRAFSSPRELVALLAGSDQVARCFAKEWARFGLGRAETAADEPSLDHAFARFAASGQNVRELLVGLVVSPTFRYRAPSAGEVIQ